MAEILSLVFFTVLGLVQFFTAASRLRNRRDPLLICVLDSIAELLMGLGFIAMGLTVSGAAQAFLDRMVVRDLTNWIIPGLLLLPLLWLVVKAGLWYARRRLTPITQKRPAGQVAYQDVTGLVSVAALTNRPEAMVRALEELEFHSIGLLRSDAPQSAEPDLIEVNEIFASPDECVFACDAVALRTALSDGTIVDTTLLVEHAPGTSRMKRWLARFRWPRANRPGAGYYFECMEDTSPQALWTRHQERLGQTAARRGVTLPIGSISSPLSLKDYIDLTRRGLHIAMNRTMLEMWILAIGLPTAMFLPVIILLLLGMKGLPLGFTFLWGVPLTGLAILASRYLPFAALREAGDVKNTDF